MTTPFTLSSWNYGSCYPSNPFYKEKPIRSKSATRFPLNEHGKRYVPPEEKIVTNDYLIMMKEIAIIKGEDIRNKSVNRVNTAYPSDTEENLESAENMQTDPKQG